MGLILMAVVMIWYCDVKFNPIIRGLPCQWIPLTHRIDRSQPMMVMIKAHTYLSNIPRIPLLLIFNPWSYIVCSSLCTEHSTLIHSLSAVPIRFLFRCSFAGSSAFYSLPFHKSIHPLITYRNGLIINRIISTILNRSAAHHQHYSWTRNPNCCRLDRRGYLAVVEESVCLTSSLSV